MSTPLPPLEVAGTDAPAPAPNTLGALVRRIRAGTMHNNSLWIMSASAGTALLGYVYWIGIARIYPARTVGVATALVSLMIVTALVANLGAAPAMITRLPTRKTLAEWSSTLSAGIIGGAVFGLIGSGIVIACVPAFSHHLVASSRDPGIVVAFVIGTMAWVVGIVVDSAFIAERAGKLMSVRNTFFALVKIPIVILPAIAVAKGSGVLIVVSSWSAGTVLSCILALWLMVPRIKPGARIRVQGVVAELRQIASLLIGNHFVTLGNVLPTYLLPVVVLDRISPSHAAYFYSTWMVGGIFFMISSATGSALYAEGSHHPDRIRETLLSSLRFTCLLLAPAMIFVLITAPWILDLLGSAYSHNGTTLLRILTLAAVLDAITNLYVPVLRVRRRLLAAGGVTMGMAIFAVVGGWLVGPSDGLTGIGVIWMASQGLGGLWVLFDVRWQHHRGRAFGG